MVSGRAQGFYISVNDIVSRTFQKLAFFSPVYGNREISCFFSSLLQISNLNRAEYFRSTTAGCSPWRSCGIDASSGKKKQFTRICKISKSYKCTAVDRFWRRKLKYDTRRYSCKNKEKKPTPNTSRTNYWAKTCPIDFVWVKKESASAGQFSVLCFSYYLRPF